MLNKEGTLSKRAHKRNKYNIKKDKWNIIKTECRARRDQGKIQIFWNMSRTSNSLKHGWGQNTKAKWDGSNRKNTKSVIKENTTPSSNKTMTCDKKTMTSIAIFHVYVALNVPTLAEIRLDSILR